MADDIFISYSRRDLAFVTQLHQTLAANGLSAWFDQTDIHAGDQWRESIVNGIIGCKLFLLVLSPDSVASKNVRKEINLADWHDKPIVPVMWRQTDIPPAIQFPLAGVQYLDFQASASQENFNSLLAVISKVLQGASLAEATAGTQSVRTMDTPAQSVPATASFSGRRSRLSRNRLAQKPVVSAQMTGGLVLARVVTPLTLDVEAQDLVNAELQWLFSAADHLLRVRREDVDRTATVPVAIPPGAERVPAANNAILPTVDDFSLQLAESQVESIIKQINIYIKNLTFELDKEAQLGGAAAANIALMNSIKAQRTAIVERTQELAKLMQQLYGVTVYSPDELAEFLQ